jgi:hypothetical protein
MPINFLLTRKVLHRRTTWSTFALSFKQNNNLNTKVNIMKNRILFLITLVLLGLSVSLSATNSPETDLKNTVTQMIKPEVFDLLGADEQAEVRIKFFITSDNELRVISVETENPGVRDRVIQTLDHASIDGSNLLKKFHYNLTVRFLHPRA